MAARKIAASGPKARAAKFTAKLGMEYLDKLPASIPPDKVLFHNGAQPTRRLGVDGFRAWFVNTGDDRHARREVCDCGWAPELGPHYRVVPERATR